MIDIGSDIDKFEAISLNEMNAIRLMNRQDTKFIFHERKLAAILKDLFEDYKILEIDGQRIANYENIYFETSDFAGFKKHQRGRVNRTKIRIRKYLESNLSFVEIKLKNNKQRTIKNRIKLEANEDLKSQRVEDYLREHSSIDPLLLTEKIMINFKRITLAHKQMEDRCTLDFDLQTSYNKEEYNFEKLVIAELKQEKFKHASPFNLALKKHHVYPASFSKYCMSLIKLQPSLKHNNFKPNLHQLEKILL